MAYFGTISSKVDTMATLLVIIYIAFISLGLPDSVLGAAWPVMHLDLGAGISQAGLISMTICACTIISSLMSQRLVARFKTHGVTTISIALTAIALFGFSRATALWNLILLAIPLGLGAGSIDAALNNYVALHFKAKHMSFLHCFWGVGTLFGPFLVSGLISNGGTWRNAYMIIAAVQAVIMVIVLFSAKKWKKENTDNKEAEKEEVKIYKTKELVRIKGVPFALLAFTLYCGFENTAMLWSASFMVYGKGFTAAEGASLAAMVFMGITAGRFINGFASSRFDDKTLILTGQIITVIATIALIFANSIILCFIGLFLMGMGFGPTYPCMIHQTVYYYDRKYSQGIIGLQMASAYVGSTLVPPLYGLIAGKTTQNLLPIWILALLIIQIFCTSMKNKYSNR